MDPTGLPPDPARPVWPGARLVGAPLGIRDPLPEALAAQPQRGAAGTLSPSPCGADRSPYGAPTSLSAQPVHIAVGGQFTPGRTGWQAWHLGSPEGGLKHTAETTQIALFFSLLNFINTLFLFYYFVPNSILFQFQSMSYGGVPQLGIDGIGLWLIWLVCFLTPIVLLSCWKINPGVPVFSKYFIILILIIQFLSLAVFIVLDLLLFYINFETVLIPMFFLIAFWGGRNRKIHAAYQFFLYTLLGSLFLLLSIALIFIEIGTCNYHILSITPISTYYQNILWVSFFLSFAIKIPMFPMHIWLPEAHSEAPTAASVILAAILLK